MHREPARADPARGGVSDGASDPSGAAVTGAVDGASDGAGMAETGAAAAQGPSDGGPLGGLPAEGWADIAGSGDGDESTLAEGPVDVADARMGIGGPPTPETEGEQTTTDSARTAPMTPPVRLRAFMRASPNSPDEALALHPPPRAEAHRSGSTPLVESVVSLSSAAWRGPDGPDVTS
jgi:hypothetical protein